MTLRQRLAGAAMLQPLGTRDYRLLVFGAIVSLLGDGFYFIALAWQVYDISNVPTALSLVGLAGTVPMVALVLLGGAFSDRFDRRKLMIGADLLRAGAIGTMAVLSISGVLELWHLIGLVVFVGAGQAFFNPASTAILPDILADEHLPAANAFGGLYRPIVARMIGPAIAGFVVAAAGSGLAFGVDALSFLVSAVAVAAMHPKPSRQPVEDHGPRRILADVREGLRYVRGQPWIWATLVSAMLSLLVFLGPMEVLVPYLVKNRLSLGPESLGAIFAAGGIGSMLMAVVVGSVGQPKRRVTAMYVSWSLGVLSIAGYGLMTSIWHALVLSFLTAVFFEFGSVIWTTMLQQRVPRELLGRVSSLDWLVSTGLVPISFALTGPVAAIFGPEQTIVGASVIGALLMGLLLFYPGVRDPERDEIDVVRPSTAEGSAG